jgi:DNA-binding NtrC family response regulator
MICDEYGMSKKTIDAGAMKLLQQYNWTGNIRELRNVVERLVILSKDKISKQDVENHVLSVAGSERNRLHELFNQFDNVESLHSYIAKEYEAFKGVYA